MKMTLRGIAILKEHEGRRLKPYTDTVGKLTIGYGRNLTDIGISDEEARILFAHDVENAENACLYHFPWFRHLDEVRKDIIVNLVFNMGINGVKEFKRMIAAIDRQDWAQAAWELSNSHWKQQVGKERHDCLTEALEHGRWPE